MIKRKDKNKHNFWKLIHFKYKISIINENTLEEVGKVRLSLFWSAFMIIFFAVLLVVATSVIIITTPIRNYLPGYLNSEVQTTVIKAALRADSLETTLNQQAVYLKNLHAVFAGKLDTDSLKKLDTVRVSIEDKSLEHTKLEKKYTNQFEEDEKYNLSVFSSGTDTPTNGVSFFRPSKGVISEKFDPMKHHFGVTIVTAPKESVLATLEGKVIFAGFDPKEGSFIQVQHKNGFVSVYRHNALLLKNVGDKVRTGEAIAVVGNDESETVTSKTRVKAYLHFELWYKGNPVDPETYISF